MKEGAVFIAFSHIFLTLLFVLAGWLKNKEYKYLSRFIILVGYIFYIIISCFRKIDYGWGGDDSIGYRIIFEKSNLSFFDYFFTESKKEHGFRFILWMVRRYSKDYRYCLFIFHSITYTALAYFIANIKKDDRVILNVFVTYLITSNLFFTFHLMRTGVAISLCSACFILFEKKNYEKAFLILVAAISMHYSAWMVLVSSIPFYIADKAKVDIKSILKLYIPIGIILELVFLYRTRGTLPFYFMYDNHNGVSDGTIIAFTSLLLLLENKRRRNKEYTFHEMMIATTLLIIPVNNFYTIANRMWLLYFPFAYAILAKIQTEIMGDRNNKHILKKKDFLLVCFSIAYIMIRVYLVAFREDFAYTLNYALEF